MERDMKAKCTLEFCFSDEKSSDAAFKALSHEGKVGNRSSSEMQRAKNDIIIEIIASDVVAMRASVNAYLRALQVIKDIDEV